MSNTPFLVALVGQEILRGKHIREGGVTCEDWLHFIISLVCHDIGYVKGVCRADQDRNYLYATGKGDEMVLLEPGASERFPHPLPRGPGASASLKNGLATTGSSTQKSSNSISNSPASPVPKEEDHQDTRHFPGLVRAADLIGQLSDPPVSEKDWGSLL